jgi:soluble lytic murein transglycosylase-like protein
MQGWLVIPRIIGLLCCSAAVQAQSIPVGYRQVAIEYDVPPVLFYAVALTESGQSSLSNGLFRPWPWALNINGEGRYFPSRQMAWLALQEAGSSVDIGLMQISWRYHRAALGSTWQALDPYHNLRVAAAILRDCYVEHANWISSTGCYHAPNDPAKAQAYAMRVKQHWTRLGDTGEEVWIERP